MVVSTVYFYTSYTHLVAQLGGVSKQRLNLVSLVQLSPLLWRRRFPIWDDADAGAEQWYKTIAKLMQGRNSIPHILANLVFEV